MKKRANILAILFVALVIVSTVTGEIIYVDDDAGGVNDGSSWADAYNDLKDGLAVAESGDEIRVAHGVYKPGLPPPPPPPGLPESPLANSRSATFQLINDVIIKGGYAGFGESEPDARDFELYETILSGDLVGNDVDVNDLQDSLNDPCRADNSLHVVTGSNTDETAVLDGFTITAGNANGTHLYYRGGGICNDRGSPTINNCTFSSNSALDGGGMYNYRGSPILTGCTFNENWAGGGGGMDNFGGSPTLNNCAFINNWAWEGGGVCNGRDCNSTLTNCTFRGNSANSYGGGMYNGNSSPILLNCIFSGNLAFRGGGMYNYSSNPTVTNCTFSGNSASYSGGGIYNGYSSNPTLTNCNITLNYTSSTGGGITCFNYCRPKINSCDIINNMAGVAGGGISCSNSSPTIINCTINGNTALAMGGGISCSPGPPPPPPPSAADSSIEANLSSGDYYYSNDTGPTQTNSRFSGSLASESYVGNYSYLTLKNCIISGNSAGSYGGGMYNYVSYPTLTNCTLSDNSAGSYGGGIYNEGSDATLSNCILWADAATEGGEIYLVLCSDYRPYMNIYSTINMEYCDVNGGVTGVYVGTYCTLNWGQGNIDTDPRFVDPGFWDSNGVWIEGDYHMLAGSPCINAGDPNYVSEPNEMDLDGKPRIFGCQIDMGAFEYMKLVPAEVRIVPHNINLANKGRWITCYIWLPESYNIADIDLCILLLEDEIQPEQFWFNEENQIVAARFNHEQLQGILDIGAVELTITAQLTDGTVFEGTDIIKVIHEGGRKLAKYGKASNPNPSDGAKGVSMTADLSWTAGSKATSHDVYFGTSSTPPFVCNQIDTTFDTGTMDCGITYYWRIDEVHKWGKTNGELWSFTTIENPVPPPPPPFPPPPPPL